MADYLSREFVLSCVDSFLSKTDMPIAAQYFYDCFRECEAADVQPVVHGEWLSRGGDWWICSHCKKNIIFSSSESDRLEKQRYCSRCGARMDGDSNG